MAVTNYIVGPGDPGYTDPDLVISEDEFDALTVAQQEALQELIDLGIVILLKGDTANIVVTKGGVDEICTGDGADKIYSGADDDYVNAGGGNDLIIGDDDNSQAGNDVLSGEGGNDRIVGRAGDDQIFGGEGDDFLDGGQGRDIISGGDGNDTIKGGSQADDIWGGLGEDDIDGGSGNDNIYAGGQADKVKGGTGNDVICGEGGEDDIQGDAGNDDIDGGAAADTIRGGEGNDDIYGNDASDDLNGDAGEDNVCGGQGNDMVRGGADNDMLDGGVGNDTVRGEAGDDMIIGGDGNDTLYGGEGVDTFIFNKSDAQTGFDSDTIYDWNVGIMVPSNELRVITPDVDEVNDDVIALKGQPPFGVNKVSYEAFSDDIVGGFGDDAGSFVLNDVIIRLSNGNLIKVFDAAEDFGYVAGGPLYYEAQPGSLLNTNTVAGGRMADDFVYAIDEMVGDCFECDKPRAPEDPECWILWEGLA